MKAITSDYQERMMKERVAIDKIGNTLLKKEFTLYDAKECVQLLKDIAHDDEVAHSLEKALWKRVLIELSNNNELAKEILATENIEFSRWFA